MGWLPAVSVAVVHPLTGVGGVGGVVAATVVAAAFRYWDESFLGRLGGVVTGRGDSSGYGEETETLLGTLLVVVAGGVVGAAVSTIGVALGVEDPYLLRTPWTLVPGFVVGGVLGALAWVVGTAAPTTLLDERTELVSTAMVLYGAVLGTFFGLSFAWFAMRDPLPMAVYDFLVVPAIVAALVLMYLVWERRESSGAVPLLALFGGGVVWNASMLFVRISATYQASLFWEAAKYVGITMVVASWFTFALEYTGHEGYLTRRTVGLLAVEPALLLLVVFTVPYHDLFWRGVWFAPGVQTDLVGFGHGPLFWIHTGYSYLLLMTGVVVMVRMLYRSQRLYREQIAALVVAIVVPWIANGLFLAGLTYNDYTPTGYIFSGALLFFAITRFDLMDLAPVARDTVVENIENGVLVLDENDRVIDVNPRGKAILNPEAESIIGEPLSTVLSDYPEIVERYDGVAQASDSIVVDTAAGPRHYEIRISPLSNDRDRDVGRLFLIHDITDQKHRQRELERQNQQLEQFASLVSHDLRNPLNVADGYLEVAKETGDREALEKVDRSHERMRRLIDDVLTLAREGRTVEETAPVDLDSLAREAWRNVDTANATLAASADVYVVADEDRLLRVFENLFRNAIEHAGESVTVRVGRIGDPDATLLHDDERGFYVADDGPGIPRENRDDVLEDGFTTAEGGTGLGLSIVTSIVEAHGWDVAVTESDDGGARFEVTGVDVTPDRDRSPRD